MKKQTNASIHIYSPATLVNFPITWMTAPYSGTYFITTFTKASRTRTSSLKISMWRLLCLINTIHFLSFLDSICSAIAVLQTQLLGAFINCMGFSFPTSQSKSYLDILTLLQQAMLLAVTGMYCLQLS